MGLIEVIPGLATAQATTDRVTAFAKGLGKAVEDNYMPGDDDTTVESILEGVALVGKRRDPLMRQAVAVHAVRKKVARSGGRLIKAAKMLRRKKTVPRRHCCRQITMRPKLRVRINK